MALWTFGDSYTVGWGCEPTNTYYKQFHKPGDLIWPELLANKLKTNLNNKGLSGSSNYNILSTLQENYFSIMPGDTVVLYVGYMNRVEYFYDAENPKHTYLQIGQDWNERYERYGLTKDKFKSIERYLVDIVMDNESHKHFVMQEFLFYKRLLEEKGITVLLWKLSLYKKNKHCIEHISDITDISEGHWTYNGHQEFYKLFLEYFNL